MHEGKMTFCEQQKQRRKARNAPCWANYMFSSRENGLRSLRAAESACRRQQFPFERGIIITRSWRRSSCLMVIPSMQSEEPQHLVVPVVFVPDENSIMTPGELRQVSLDYELFQSILKSGSTFFGCIKADECSSGITGACGALITLLMVKGVEQENGPRVVLDCRCSSRLAVLKTTEQSVNPNLTMARVQRVRDNPEESFAERSEVSHLEWNLWNACREVSGLLRKLQNDKLARRVVEQELAVWAPKVYDKEIEEHEWEATPHATRQVFWERAECFSFGILRCMEGDENVSRKARHLTRTSDRLRMALEFLQEKKAVTYAQLSLKNALD